MAFSKTQLISNALVLLGDEPISSITEPGAGAKASVLYESAYFSMLSSHTWKFATKKKELSKLSEAPLNEFQFQYQLPTDFIVIITTYPASTYKILGDKLYTDSSSVEIDYIYKITEDQFPPYFIEAFEYYLAAKLAIPITDDLNKMDVMQRKYELVSRNAKYADNQSAPAISIIDTPYKVVRNF